MYDASLPKSAIPDGINAQVKKELIKNAIRRNTIPVMLKYQKNKHGYILMQRRVDKMKDYDITLKMDNREAIKGIEEVELGLKRIEQLAQKTGLSDFLKWQANKINQLKSKKKKAAKIIAAQKLTIEDLSKELSYYRKTRAVERCNPCEEHDRVNPNYLPNKLNIIRKGDSLGRRFRKKRL
jgi:hypothetical protein